MIRRLIVLVGACSLASCTFTSGPVSAPRPSPATTTTTNDSGTRGAGATAPESRTGTTAAAQALIEQSRGERDDGDLSRAAATIERALTFAPDDAELWIELAEIRWDQGDGQLAEEMARKALTLTSASSSVAARARRLIPR